jgi:hypothetical protein
MLLLGFFGGGGGIERDGYIKIYSSVYCVVEKQMQQTSIILNRFIVFREKASIKF